MDEINRKIQTARRRVMWNHFLRVISWTLLATLVLIAVGIAIPKIWHLAFLDDAEAANFWMAGWVIGGSILGLFLAAGLTIVKRQSLLNVAVEVDRRFGLKSRLSSTLSMSADDQASVAGAALAQDAAQQAELIDVRDEFKIETPWQLCLPLVAGLLVFGLLFVPNAEGEIAGENVAVKKDAEEREKVVTAVDELKKKILAKRTSTGLKDAELNFDAFEKSMDELENKNSVSKKEALVKLNDLKKQIEQQQNKLGSSKDLREQLNKLKEAGNGPAQKLGEAMKSGDMAAAKKAIQDLAKKLKDGDLTKAQQERLKNDLEQMAKQMKAIADAQQQKKEELKKQIAEAQAKGDLDKAAKLQEKLEQAQKQDAAAKKMAEMSKKLGQCAKCMGKQGKGKKEGGQKAGGQKGQPGESPQQDAEAEMKDAAQQMEDLAKQIAEMQDEMEELEDMEDLQEAIEQAKAEMNGQGEGEGDEPGNGMGEGKGFGMRPKEKNNTGNFKSRVRGKLQKGRIVATGTADGENLTGRTASETREIIEAEMSSRKEAVENQLLPKSQREHTKQYFQRVLDGQ